MLASLGLILNQIPPAGQCSYRVTQLMSPTSQSSHTKLSIRTCTVNAAYNGRRPCRALTYLRPKVSCTQLTAYRHRPPEFLDGHGGSSSIRRHHLFKEDQPGHSADYVPNVDHLNYVSAPALLWLPVLHSSALHWPRLCVIRLACGSAQVGERAAAA